MDTPHNSEQDGKAKGGDLCGRLLGRFRIESRLGVGGMGEVYLAEDTRLKRRVALKRMAPQWRSDRRLAERFRREVELASRFTHPHIAAVYDVFEYEDETFLVMEYVDGQTLRRRLQGRPIPPAEFLEIAMQCASALIAAHDHGVLHRDLKPDNILITRDAQVKILDFGLAKDLPRSTESTLALTDPGIKGTPGYMAPEALLEKEVDARADLFSLGVVFYEMLAGKHPFLRRGDSFVTTVNRVLGETPKPLHSLNPNVYPSLDAIVTRLLAKEPHDRYANGRELAADLKAAAGGSAITAPVPLSSVRRSRRRLMVAAVLVVLAVAAGFWTYRHFTRPVVTTNDWILIADFSNQSGQPIFDDTVTQALRDALEQSRHVQLVPRSQAVNAARLMGQTSVSSITAALGRQICVRENYRGLLTGSIRSLPPDYVVSIKLEDPVQGLPVYSSQVTFHQPAQLYPAIDRLARQLRENLGESLTEIRNTSAPLARVTTPSLDALQRYTRGMHFYNDGRYTDALGLFQSAIAADPDFAMAHLYLAQVYDQIGKLPAKKQEMNKALAGIDRVSERERYLIQALHSEDEGDYTNAVSQYRLLTQLYPSDLYAWKGLGEAATYAVMSDQAIEAERHVLQISPDNGADYSSLILLLVSTNQPQDAIHTYQAAVKRGIDNTGIHRGAGIAYMVLGDLEAAGKQFRLCAGSGDLYGQDISSLYQAALLLYQGKLSQAIPDLQAGLVLDIKQGSEAWTPLRRLLLAEALLAQGKTADAAAQARQLADTAAKLNQGEFFAFAGILSLRTGQRQLAQASLQKLVQLRAERPNASYDSSSYYYLRGAIELAEGRPADALSSELRAYAFFPIPDVLRVEGQAYAALHQWDKAAAAYRDYLNHAGEIFNFYSPLDWALAHIDLARALASAGQRAAAVSAYDDFLRLWSGADSNLSALRQAQAERVKIGALKDFAQASKDKFRAPIQTPGGKHGEKAEGKWQEKKDEAYPVGYSRRLRSLEGIR
jgi:tetratricopeptide (TPR) repeat protein/tRNA A-37 threonylcarbamoyl transferase component Bud32